MLTTGTARHELVPQHHWQRHPVAGEAVVLYAELPKDQRLPPLGRRHHGIAGIQLAESNASQHGSVH